MGLKAPPPPPGGGGTSGPPRIDPGTPVSPPGSWLEPLETPTLPPVGDWPVPTPIPEPITPPETITPQADREATVSAAGGVVPCVYGTVRVGAQVFAVLAQGGSLYVALAVAEGPIDSYTSIKLDGQSSLAGVSVETHLGTDSQAVSSFMHGASAAWTQTFPGLAYIVLRISGSADVQGIPTVLAVIKGKKILDTRTSTTAYSENPAMIVRDVLTGAGGLSSAYLDEQSFKDAGDYFDATVDGEARFSINLACTNRTDVRSWLSTLLAHCASSLVVDQGVYSLVVDKTLSGVVYAFDDDSVRDVTIARRNSSDTPNRVFVEWTNAANDWQAETAPPAETPAVTAGTRDPVEKTYQCQGITSAKLATRLALYLLRRQTLSDLSVSFTASPVAEKVRRGDLITLTHREIISAQQLVVVTKTDAGGGEWNITAEEYDSSVYSTAAVVVDTPPSIGLPDPMAAPDDVLYATQVNGIATVSGTAVLTGGQFSVTTTRAWALRYDLPTTSPVPLLQLRLRLGATWGANPDSEIVIPLVGNTSKDTGQTQAYKLEVPGWIRQSIVDVFYAVQEGSTDPITRTTYTYDPDVIIKVESARGVLSAGVHVGGAAMTTTVDTGAGTAGASGGGGFSPAFAYFYLGR